MVDVSGVFGFVKQLWDTLNGNKTKIGATLLLIGGTIAQVQGIFEFNLAILDSVGAFCSEWGAKIGTVGLVHKSVKVIPVNFGTK